MILTTKGAKFFFKHLSYFQLSKVHLSFLKIFDFIRFLKQSLPDQLNQRENNFETLRLMKKIRIIKEKSKDFLSHAT